jgi:Lrp/AsnC family transcriptional regulator for asnA, asnC and gidA
LPGGNASGTVGPWLDRAGGGDHGPGARASELDRRIIGVPAAGWAPAHTQIAAELGVSEAAVRARTNRLIERGVLQIVGVADPLKLGFNQMAMIGVRCDGAQLVAAADAIAKLPEVIYVVATAGAYDLLVEAVCEDSEALLEFLTQRLGRVEGVRSTETFIYLRIVKQSYQLGNH